jgi:hypothetical protein
MEPSPQVRVSMVLVSETPDLHRLGLLREGLGRAVTRCHFTRYSTEHLEGIVLEVREGGG